MEWEIAELWKSVGMTEDMNTRRIWGNRAEKEATPADADAEADASATPQAGPSVSNIINTETEKVMASNSDGGSSVGSDKGEKMGTNPMGTNYLKCKAARGAELIGRAAEVGLGKDRGDIDVKKKRVGNMDLFGDEELLKTFRGTRISAYGEVVNQSISCSFDPGTMVCMVCDKEHDIMPTNGEQFVMILTDQNFVPTLSGGNNCVPVLRLEDASLLELYRIANEILDRRVVPSGALFLIGSTSYLAKVGTSMYTMEWQAVVASFEKRWRDAIVSPLTPILREGCDGIVARNLLELKHWFETVYGNSICFFKGNWQVLEEVLVKSAGDISVLDRAEVYTLPLPIGLRNKQLKPVPFRVSSTHAEINGFGEGTDELIRALFEPLNSNFGVNANPDEIIVVRELAEQGGLDLPVEGKPLKVIVMGGSHSKRTVSELRYRGFDVVDLSVPGWVPSESNVAKLLQDLEKINPGVETVAVCDFTSNVVFRYLNLGVEGMACKMGGRYHMPGAVTTCNKDSLSHFLSSVKVLMEKIPGLKVCVPPLPRYLFVACCDEQGHCEGLGTANYAGGLLEKTLSVRKHMKELLTGLYKDTVVVPELIQKMFPGSKSTSELVKEIEKYSSIDGVHLTSTGYGLVADVIKSTIVEKLSAVNSVSGGREHGGKPVFWKGFLSLVGSSRPTNNCQRFKTTHQRGGGGKWVDQRTHFGSAGQGSAVYGQYSRGFPPGGRRRY